MGKMIGQISCSKRTIMYFHAILLVHRNFLAVVGTLLFVNHIVLICCNSRHYYLGRKQTNENESTATVTRSKSNYQVVF